MTAQGKITAASLFTALTHVQGEGPVRILLVMEDADLLKRAGVGRAPGLAPATRKTGVLTLAAVEAETRMVTGHGWTRRGQRQYRFRTSQGWTLWMSPAQTIIRAPEDAAAVKRAHVEALKEYGARQEAEAAKTQEVLAEAGALITEVAERHGLELERQAERGKRALKAIGGCWAGGALTGKALKAYADGDYALALTLAADQKALQEEDPEEAVHPERRAGGSMPEPTPQTHDYAASYSGMVCGAMVERPDGIGDACGEPVKSPIHDPAAYLAYRAELEEELGKWSRREGEYAQEVLELAEKAAPELAARLATGSVAEVLDQGPVTELAPGVLVAPMGSPAPGPEDLADLALALSQEELEHTGPEEVRVPKGGPARCQPRDVVTIHRGTRLYLVERVEADASRNNLTGETVDHTMALVSPVDPEDFRDPQWVHVDLLHVREPVARLRTEEITGRVRQTREALKVEGSGFYGLEGDLRVVRTILVDSARVPVATLVAPPFTLAAPVATLRVGEAIVVDGRCFAVTQPDPLEERVELVPAPHRDRLR